MLGVPSRIHGVRLEVKQSHYIMQLMKISNKVVNNTYAFEA